MIYIYNNLLEIWFLAEGITIKSLVCLKEADLKELGFKLGERRLLLEWIDGQKSTNSPASLSLPQSPSLPSLDESLLETTTPISSIHPAPIRPKRLQMFKVRIVHLKNKDHRHTY